MPIPHNQNTTPFEDTCARILIKYPEAIGVAFKWLDCGCSLLCGVDAVGDPVGPLMHVGSQATTGACPQCKKDVDLNRVVWQGIHWPGSPEEYPEMELRLSIGRKVFGPGYTET
jgi:hypothetical protein